MKPFIKKLLARYVVYVEVTGYAFVILFFGGLVALAFVKAEDEFAVFKGRISLPVQSLRVDCPAVVLDTQALPGATVNAGQALIDTVTNQVFVTDRMVLDSLDTQIASAARQGRNDLIEQLKPMAESLRTKHYPDLKTDVIIADIPGEFILWCRTNQPITGNIPAGAVADFTAGIVVVTNIAPDNRKAAQLKPGQPGTALLKIDGVQKLSLPLIVKSVTKTEVILSFGQIPESDRATLANWAAAVPPPPPDADVKILVGWKSWLRLVWR